MIPLAVLAQLLDLATYAPAREVNPIVVGLGILAPAVKLLLIVAVVALALSLGRAHERRTDAMRRLLLATAIVVGVSGAWTNIA